MQLNQDHEGSLLYETVTTKIIFGLFFPVSVYVHMDCAFASLFCQ